MPPMIVSSSAATVSREVEAFLNRPAFDPTAERIAMRELAAIRGQGCPAILDAVRRFQGVTLRPSALRVSALEWRRATAHVPRPVAAAVREAHRRVTAFATAGLRRNWRMTSPGGGHLGERFLPLDRIGVYVPGGTAPLASTAIMTATLAQVAGVREIVACTPCGADKQINPVLLYALRLAGATEVYRVGGIQAVGLMAFGFPGVRPVEKIVGPGNAYVTAAKRQVYGYVAIDQVAGPSEIAVLADSSAKPAWVAADLLSQLEHGSGLEKALLVTDSALLARAVADELVWQIPKLSRQKMITRAIDAGGLLLVVVPNLHEGITLCNRFAPEHLELMTRQAARLLPEIRTAGAVFVGPWTPESAGDFVAGPSHVLPTGGAARMFSGLTVEDFRRRTSFVQFTRRDLEQTLPVIQAFGKVEGLDAHVRSAAIRCK